MHFVCSACRRWVSERDPGADRCSTCVALGQHGPSRASVAIGWSIVALLVFAAIGGGALLTSDHPPTIDVVRPSSSVVVPNSGCVCFCGKDAP